MKHSYITLNNVNYSNLKKQEIALHSMNCFPWDLFATVVI